ncbi:serine protease [Rhizobium ruizarguesonis]|uniref:Serine protease n=2 Tax=Rhizobium ruizarguesonis TaxID=2081791 RepID=A0AB38HQ67_9HYPH|nr:serine protease [Rhizobium ruizarguesonis]TAZ92108.1 serine protease [Rhizobium ruizarguesonis]TBC01056.1 serine protease [Rhizobium ruizarguesonis]
MPGDKLKMNYATRQAYYRAIEADRGSKVIAFVTGDRHGLQTQIAVDAVEPFVSLLDTIGPTKKISLILDTHGGQTSAAWRLINLLRSFGDEIEIIVPTKAMSAGTLMALGADAIVMTKQAALGPIDPSLSNHPLNPVVNGNQFVAVSAEAVRGYLDEVKKDLNDPAAIAEVWVNLANQIHPIVLGEIFRLGGQIRSMAKTLIQGQVKEEEVQDKIINLLCSDSGSHDYTINRRYAAEIGLNILKPSAQLYDILSQTTKSYHAELKTLEPYNPVTMLSGNPKQSYQLVRGLIEGTEAGCYGFVSEGELSIHNAGAGPVINDARSFEGWRKLP